MTTTTFNEFDLGAYTDMMVDFGTAKKKERARAYGRIISETWNVTWKWDRAGKSKAILIRLHDYKNDASLEIKFPEPFAQYVKLAGSLGPLRSIAILESLTIQPTDDLCGFSGVVEVWGR